MRHPSEHAPGSEPWRFRPATADDLATLVAFTEQEGFEAEGLRLNRADVERGVAGAFSTPPRARCWVVTSGIAIIASVSITTEWSNFHGADYWWIQSVFVVPEARGRGVVDWMLSRLRQEARAGGARDLRLYAHAANGRARRVYERAGFSPAAYVIYSLDPSVPPRDEPG